MGLLKGSFSLNLASNGSRLNSDFLRFRSQSEKFRVHHGHHKPRQKFHKGPTQENSTGPIPAGSDPPSTHWLEQQPLKIHHLCDALNPYTTKARQLGHSGLHLLFSNFHHPPQKASNRA
ncbi:UvrABC system protein C [Striga asiatica]|uniref:UvrABC system protein C n=1 Tax=Striga asiatica TaxID=4170 RepID=A0A5A7P7A2_STRAF|nr:UvrABC system protein C [Striga asiatica]